MRSGRKSASKTRRGHIFKTTNQLNFIESKEAFRDLLRKNTILNDKLHEKLDFYFSPYCKKNMNTENYNLKFSQPPTEDGEDENKKLQGKAQVLWKSILDYVLSKDTERTRALLKSINPGLYIKIKNLGQQYYLKEFNKEIGKKAFPDIENPKVLNQISKEDIILKSIHLEEGIKSLRKEVSHTILKNGFTLRNSKANTREKIKKPDILTPLVFLLRGNQEIRKKKRKILAKVKSQVDIKHPVVKRQIPDINPIFSELSSGYNITEDPVTHKLEYKDKI